MTQKATILCVDDEPSILDALKEQLNRYLNREYAIECAENGEKALALFRELAEDQYDVPVVISDHIMPGMKGDEFLRQVFELNPAVKKILLTGQADADAVGRAVNMANLYRYISKPWQHDDLVLTIQEAVRSYYQDRTLAEQNIQLKKVNEELGLLNTKLERKVEIFNKFVPRQFLNILHIDSDEYIELSQCISRELTIMFADIRSFTKMCEGMTSSQAFEFINNYLLELGPVITQNHGFIDKFIGDAIMAIFEKAEDAIAAGIAMHQQLEYFNQKQMLKGQGPIKIGIGINTAIVMLGTIGEANRLQTTVIGDAVNLAQRTEKVSKDFNTKVVITENTFEKSTIQKAYSFRFLDYSQVKGKNVPVNFYELLDVFDSDTQKRKLSVNDLYKKGVMAFHRNDIDEAEAIFKECLGVYSEDNPTHIYLGRIREVRDKVKKLNQ